MPTYVYECSKCNTVFEADQRIIEPPLDTCTCGSVGTVKRLIQPTMVMFKGSGFYVNDSAHVRKPAAEESGTFPETTPTPAPAAEPAATPAPAPSPETSAPKAKE